MSMPTTRLCYIILFFQLDDSKTLKLSKNPLNLLQFRLSHSFIYMLKRARYEQTYLNLWSKMSGRDRNYSHTVVNITCFIWILRYKINLGHLLT